MTRVLICLLVVFTAFSLSAEKRMKKTNSIVGTWESAFKGKKITMKLNADGTMELGEGEKVMKGTYKIDLTVTPHHLDLTFGERTKLSIFKFIDKDNLKMDEPSKERPKKFGDRAIDFKRQ